MRTGWIAAICGVVALGAVSARGEERVIRVTKAPENVKMGIDLSEIVQGAGDPGGTLVRTIGADLELSGWFKVVPANSGSIRVRGRTSGAISMDCEVVQAATGRTYLRKSYSETPAQVMLMAHRIADDIIYAVKGVKGIASTKIAMIGSSGGKGADLYYCYAGGGGAIQLTRDGKYCSSPAWAPDGQMLYYTSMKSGFPDVYQVDLGSRRRTRISKYPGLNDGSAVSPDGRFLALTLSKDGNAELYVMDIGSGRLQRLTSTRQAAEASPTWSPDGSEIAYVSDTSGKPQIYIISRSGGSSRRLRLVGGQNVSPDWGPDGRIAYSSLLGGRFQICVVAPSGGEILQLTHDGNDHEEPSWAPDARHIVYTKIQKYHKSLYILDTLGDPELALTRFAGEWKSPAWSSR